MHPAFARTQHRPWALPSRRWTWRQSWLDLLFMHWPMPAQILQPLVPPGLRVQEFEGTSYIGVVPFRMAGVMRRPFPDLPGISAFPELNVRIYVEHEGKAGVWFLSLDATNSLAVWAARTFFHLPYHKAQISFSQRDGTFNYALQRKNGHPEFVGQYWPEGEAYESKPGTLEHWLTERYCLYAIDPRGRLLRSDVHHVPWPLYRAQAKVQTNSMASCLGLTLPNSEPLLHFSPGLDVVIWNAEVVQKTLPTSRTPLPLPL